VITITTLLLIIVAIAVIFVFWVIWTDIIGAGWEPTSKILVRKMLEIAEVNSEDILYDLGSGDGRIIIETARKYHANAIGIEADPLRYIWSKLMILLYGVNQKVKVIWGNFFNKDITNATVVTLFLSSKANQQLKTKLQNELKPGTRIVSYYWTFHEWEPVKEDKKDKIYMYIIGNT
jgi:phospholipid N-methyltransferase